MLKTIIPETVPDSAAPARPRSLDWAIELGTTEWGVTILEVTAEVDGAVWLPHADRRRAGKSSLYRHEVRRRDAAVTDVTVIAAGEHDGRPARDRPAAPVVARVDPARSIGARIRRRPWTAASTPPRVNWWCSSARLF